MAKRKRRFKLFNLRSDYFDYNLLAVVILLTCFGLVMLYSTSAYIAEVKFDGDDMYYFRKQALISAVCILAAVAASVFDYHILYKYAGLLYVVSAILMILVQSPLGVTLNGARRWLKIGIQFQPSEFAKIAVVVAIPAIIVKMGRQYKGIKGAIIPLVLGVILSVICWKCTDNLSTAIIIGLMCCVIVFVAHPKTLPFILLAVFVVIAIIIGVNFLAETMQNSDNFRIERILVWLDPEKYS